MILGIHKSVGKERKEDGFAVPQREKAISDQRPSRPHSCWFRDGGSYSCLRSDGEVGKTAEPSSMCAGERGRAGDMKAVIAMGEGWGPWWGHVFPQWGWWGGVQQLGTSIVADSAPKLVTWPCSGHGSGQWWRPKMRNGLLLGVALLEGPAWFMMVVGARCGSVVLMWPRTMLICEVPVTT